MSVCPNDGVCQVDYNVNLYEYNQVNLHAVVSVPIIMRS